MYALVTLAYPDPPHFCGWHQRYFCIRTIAVLLIYFHQLLSFGNSCHSLSPTRASTQRWLHIASLTKVCLPNTRPRILISFFFSVYYQGFRLPLPSAPLSVSSNTDILIHSRWCKLIEECWKPLPAERPPITEVVEELRAMDELLDSTPPPSTPHDPPTPVSETTIPWRTLADMEQMLAEMQAALHRLMFLQHTGETEGTPCKQL